MLPDWVPEIFEADIPIVKLVSVPLPQSIIMGVLSVFADILKEKLLPMEVVVVIEIAKGGTIASFIVLNVKVGKAAFAISQ